jgi:hypothetical protein
MAVGMDKAVLSHESALALLDLSDNRGGCRAGPRQAFASAAEFLDPILAGRSDGEWDPQHKRWT